MYKCKILDRRHDLRCDVGSPDIYVYTGCSLNIVFFPRILENLPPLPRQYSAAIGCTKNYQPIGVTVHSHCVENFEGLHSDVGEGGVAVNCKKNTIFSEHPVYICSYTATL